MKNFILKLFHPAKTKLFWLYLVFGILGVILGVMLMPVWEGLPKWVFWQKWGRQIVNIIICACIILYLALFLFKKVMGRANSVVKILTIIEFVVLALIALGCILQQCRVFNIGGACAILGLVLWCRGTVEVFRAYYHQKGNNEKYPIWWLVVAIVMMTFGTYIYAKPLFSDVVILWIFVVLILLVSIILIADGILAKPVSNKEKKSKKAEA